MAFSGILSDEDIKAAVQACQGESDSMGALARRETHENTYSTLCEYKSIHIMQRETSFVRSHAVPLGRPGGVVHSGDRKPCR